MTLGRAAKVVPAFPPGSGTASVSRASGGPPPQQATRPKLNVMSEMEKKLKERKEKSEGGTTTTVSKPWKGLIGTNGREWERREGGNKWNGMDEKGRNHSILGRHVHHPKKSLRVLKTTITAITHKIQVLAMYVHNLL